jgi:outer membrane lipoprotein-sorting protein
MWTVLLVGAQFIPSIRAEEAAPMSARDLADWLSGVVQDGSSSVWVKMEIRAPAGGSKTVLQLQIKARRTKTATDVAYQVLWPKERKGESFLLRRTEDSAPSGTYFIPPDSLRSITSSQMKDAVFGGDLSYADLIENFFAWDQQAIVGTEIVDRVSCQILESRPGKGDRSIYGRVLSWIDPKRLVPLRVEKYFESGQQARRIDTTRVAEDNTDRKVAASLMVRRPGQDSVTELEGSKSRHDVPLSDNDFTTEALRALWKQGTNPK